jgi:hypothetical protein
MISAVKLSEKPHERAKSLTTPRLAVVQDSSILRLLPKSRRARHNSLTFGLAVAVLVRGKLATELFDLFADARRILLAE